MIVLSEDGIFGGKWAYYLKGAPIRAVHGCTISGGSSTITEILHADFQSLVMDFPPPLVFYILLFFRFFYAEPNVNGNELRFLLVRT